MVALVVLAAASAFFANSGCGPDKGFNADLRGNTNAKTGWTEGKSPPPHAYNRQKMLLPLLKYLPYEKYVARQHVTTIHAHTR